MVLTRRQRKSGINVTPTQQEKKEITIKHKSSRKGKQATAINEQEEDILSNLDNELNTSPKKKSNQVTKDLKDRGKTKIGKKIDGNTRLGESYNDAQNKHNTGSNEDDEDDDCSTDSKIENSDLYEQEKNKIKVNDKSSSEDEEEVGEGEQTLHKLKNKCSIISSFKGHVPDKESSDDEAPELVSFGAAKESALETLHQAYKESLKIKSKKKEKRRAHDTMMKEQAKKKMRRCEELDSNRLPETFLTKVNTENSERSNLEPKPDEIDEEADDSLSEDDDLFQEEDDDDYVVEKEGFQIVPLQVFAKIPVVKSMAASNFRQEQLFGKRIPRVTASTHISMSLKRSSKPAMNFKVKGIAVTKKERRQRKNNWSNLIK